MLHSAPHDRVLISHRLLERALRLRGVRISHRCPLGGWLTILCVRPRGRRDIPLGSVSGDVVGKQAHPDLIFADDTGEPAVVCGRRRCCWDKRRRVFGAAVVGSGSSSHAYQQQGQQAHQSANGHSLHRGKFQNKSDEKFYDCPQHSTIPYRSYR